MGKGKIVALLGLAGGAFAYWKYKNLSPEEKERLKEKAKKVGDEVKEAAVDIKDTLTEEFDKFSGNVKDSFNNATE
ncbi:YtxH domain-containing protein [Aureitalea sp. L0-47]|uniref:YtxH domain-containing protein n=1 Tax=Aureitalea sp. L0-47 TaxID=2816962 RepID=UPI0022390EE8|nr:YtxH domain-containing protein [Aureitalea sp. L0-47]MCW5519441.1 YtxH domain-containing protein [Aureitalea sp. L0-47]